ncbi:MAG: tRNA uridine-5-carboxymethylaminomethyl(34) synthesis GTPase MnmE [Alphaproteobacteria bacterium]|nr:MAG: tRNA uridine-5-carboxymethylaminomethyl(34) synthesis GTPase MnmE [Alphaproteobacteria bacterium]
MPHDTIFALSSGQARAGVAVIRISGVTVTAILKKIGVKEPLSPREMKLTTIHNPDSDVVIDRAMVVFFEGPRSFTGEDVAELHVHGSPAVIKELLTVLATFEDCRPAEAGEFTRRAFENGKMDLTEVEGLADLIDAETSAQKAQALRQMSGALGDLYEDWRSRLIGRLAYVEADIDFSEEDLPEGILAHVWPDLDQVATEISAHLADGHRGERLRDGYRIVILGRPNVGKSSLLNHLARRDVAIVSDEAGTTRDVLEVHLDLGGYPVTLMDTAGLREDAGAVEAEGIRRALTQAAAADLTLRVRDARDFDPTDREVGPKELVLWNKSDLIPEELREKIMAIPGYYPISVAEDWGLDSLLSDIAVRVAEELSVGEGAVLTRLRHRKGLELCLSHLEAFSQVRSQGTAADLELAAEELRLAARALGQITGRVDVEDILDVIFHDFCIGK